MAEKSPSKKKALAPNEQHKRFVSVAKEVGADESLNSMDKIMKKIASKKKTIC